MAPDGSLMSAFGTKRTSLPDSARQKESAPLGWLAKTSIISRCGSYRAGTFRAFPSDPIIAAPPDSTGMGDITQIGLGLMGSGLARALITGGHYLTPWNRCAEKRLFSLANSGLKAAPSAAARRWVSWLSLKTIHLPIIDTAWQAL